MKQSVIKTWPYYVPPSKFNQRSVARLVGVEVQELLLQSQFPIFLNRKPFVRESTMADDKEITLDSNTRIRVLKQATDKK